MWLNPATHGVRSSRKASRSIFFAVFTAGFTFLLGACDTTQPKPGLGKSAKDSIAAIDSLMAAIDSESGEWNGKRWTAKRQVNPLDSSVDLDLEVQQSAMSGRHDLPWSLIVRCQARRYVVQVGTLMQLPSESAPVRFRLDHGPLEMGLWEVRGLGNVYADHPRAMIARLMSADTMIFESSSYGSETATFLLRGLRSYKGELEKQCGALS
jgi:hypothetical protein